MKDVIREFTPEKMKYLKLLAKQFPTEQSVCTEIVNLTAIQNLPKGTEHFMSDIHGEYGAFKHILNNCSGVIREKVILALGDELSAAETDDLCTLIYYPRERLELLESEAVFIDGVGDRFTESRLVRTAVDRMDRIGERHDIAVVSRTPHQRDLGRRITG